MSTKAQVKLITQGNTKNMTQKGAFSIFIRVNSPAALAFYLKEVLHQNIFIAFALVALKILLDY